MRRPTGCLLLLGLAVWIAALASPQELLAADEQIIQQVSANGTRNLRPFTVKNGWEIRWDNKGRVLTISVRHRDGKLAAIGGAATAPGRGSSYQPRGGTYYLAVDGMGDWTVTVIQLP